MKNILSLVLPVQYPTSSFSTMYPLSFNSFGEAEDKILSEGHVKTDDIDTYKKEEEEATTLAKMYHTSLSGEAFR